ncbi:pyruvate dehydrogenase E2 component (dihydrolipoamide acetyltransferase) [Aminobacter lissarensis]|uniref:Dihydrolipoamide acetyltransferase component of pyruvate dehydrogenase complex n=2 Tax=Aminobacter carboxidus TaxID=376165 RepID=A0A8E1WH12_9HYPH|nr:pyruvate dehydrogenase E2 component (dihydrolipoamide acetyltransferase) [Aminobacter lissarensis]
MEVRLPDIGDYKNVPVVEFLVKPGDVVAVEDPLMTVESDKATMEIPAPFAGTVREFAVSIGTRVSQGALLLTIDATAPATAPSAATPETEKTEAARTAPPVKAEQPAPAKVAPAAPVVSTLPVVTTQATAGAHATPSVRAFARELGVELGAVRPSGPKGRILRDDITAHIKERLAEGSPVQAPASGIGAGLPAWPAVDYEKFGPVERQPLSRIQKISGGNLTRNWLTIPHVTNFDKADVTGLEEFRKELNAANKDAKVTMVAFLIKASALALKAYPRFNASLDGEELVLKNYVHIGFAADTPKGLMVPVIRDCDRKGVLEIASEMRALADKARGNGPSAADMQGGCFSVSSLGGIGGAGFTPIINAPEVAILGAGRSAMEAIWDGKAFQPKLIMPISLSWDHRVIDGVAAARFLGHIAALLGDFRRAIV